ncbi:MAG: UxaA family hydrolase [Pseudomonadota bacterium]
MPISSPYLMAVSPVLISFHLTALHDVPIGHKVALKDIKTGDTAIKYGEDIGKFVGDVSQGEHVHTHNLKTKRW